MEGQDAAVERVHGWHESLRQSQSAEGQRARGIDDALHVEPAGALDRAGVADVLAEQTALDKALRATAQDRRCGGGAAEVAGRAEGARSGVS